MATTINIGMIIAINRVIVPWLNDPREEHIVVTTVLVSGAIGDYAAYRGIGTEEEVRAGGDKVTFEEACAMFAGLERDHYRD